MAASLPSSSTFSRPSTHPANKGRIRQARNCAKGTSPLVQAAAQPQVAPPSTCPPTTGGPYLPYPSTTRPRPQGRSSHSSSDQPNTCTPLDKAGRPIDLNELRAKKSVQAFSKAFAASLEPTLRRSLALTLLEQETLSRARLKVTVDEVLEEQKRRITRELAQKRYEDRLSKYHTAVQEYRSRKHTTLMLLLMEVMGVTLLSLLYTYEVVSGHLGAICSFVLSAIYTVFMWRRSMLASPRKPCPYDSIAGPPPDDGEEGEALLRRSTWYERNLRWLPLPNKHTVKRAYGLFD